ncbi:MAG: S-layer domain protein [Clostridia bacterium]|nr:S-layer domain protein [Clostridia bacterium]
MKNRKIKSFIMAFLFVSLMVSQVLTVSAASDNMYAEITPAGGTMFTLPIDSANKAFETGRCTIYTPAFGADISKADSNGNKSNTVLVASYDLTQYKYLITAIDSTADKEKNADIPSDGFVIIANGSSATALKDTKIGDVILTRNFAALDIQFSIPRLTAKPTFDGIISDGEYAEITKINKDNPMFDYSMDKSLKGTGVFYAGYDDTNLYLAWNVFTPTHSLPVADANMWSGYCIQINLSNLNPRDDKVARSHLEDDSVAANYVSQYGIGVSDAGETFVVNWMGRNAGVAFTGEAKAIRDNANKTTTYEIAIPWSEFDPDNNIATKDGNKVGISFSLNVAEQGGEWEVTKFRDGGGIIGINDWSKISVANLIGIPAPENEAADDVVDENAETSDNGLFIYGIMALICSAFIIVSLRKKVK